MFPWVKRAEREADHSLPSTSLGNNNDWEGYTCTRPMCQYRVDPDYFSFNYTHRVGVSRSGCGDVRVRMSLTHP
jgi:hypothetical protein